MPVGEVKFVELLKDPGVAERSTRPEELARVEEKLIELQKEEHDGSESTATAAVPTPRGEKGPQRGAGQRGEASSIPPTSPTEER